MTGRAAEDRVRPLFHRAVPVWPTGMRSIWNQQVGFHMRWPGAVGAETVQLRITAADVYRVWCNGRYVGCGPARTAHGHARVDVWPMAEAVVAGENHLAIEVLSYGIDSYAHAMQPPFLQAELVTDGAVIGATGTDDMRAASLPERVQKVERYSAQRPFAEAYRLLSTTCRWRTHGFAPSATKSCEEVEPLVLLPRRVPYPTLVRHLPTSVIERGAVVRHDPVPSLPPCSARDGIGPFRLGYPVAELEIDITAALAALAFQSVDDSRHPAPAGAQMLPPMTQVLFDFTSNRVGFIGIRLGCEKAARVFLVFDECRDRPSAGSRSVGVSAIALDLGPGRHDFESFEVYTLRYLRVVCLEGDVLIDDLFVREYANAEVDGSLQPCAAPELATLFAAGRESFRTNAVDVFTDCQSRERGAYPCDAWFMAQSERLLTGGWKVERNFLENYLLPDQFRSIPSGMLPHCYPSDRLATGRYIPNWALWLFIQLEDYVTRSGDRSLLDLAARRAQALFAHLAGFRNQLGLLEDLPGWVFVEHSAANDFTAGVNHPTNLVYARALDACAALFGHTRWHQEAVAVRTAVRQESWDGRWFADQSVREQGRLRRSPGRSETCQYHAFFFNLADPVRDCALWQRLCTDWGPLGEAHQCCWGPPATAGSDRYARWRSEDAPATELIPVNLFYGAMLRWELLLRYHETDRLLKELTQALLPQARLTGTLWEHFDATGSCNHGFTSRVCSLLTAACQARSGASGAETTSNLEIRA